MNELLDAIFKHDAVAVRECARARPAQMSVKTDAGSFPADVAIELGDAETFVALIRAGAPSKLVPSTTDAWGRLFVNYIEWLSSSYLAANWMSDIEYHLWEAVNDVPAWQSRGFWLVLAEHGLPSAIADILGDVRFLGSKCDGWPHYESVGRWAAADAWVSIYEAWLFRQRRK